MSEEQTEYETEPPDVDTGYTADDFCGYVRVWNACTDRLNFVQDVGEDGAITVEDPYHGVQTYAPKHLVPITTDPSAMERAAARADQMGYDQEGAVEAFTELLRACESAAEGINDDGYPDVSRLVDAARDAQDALAKARGEADE